MPGEQGHNENCKLLPPSEMSPLAMCRERENGTRHFPRWSSPRGIACLESQRENVSVHHPTMVLPGWPCSLGDKGYDKSDHRKKEPSQESRSLRSSSRDKDLPAQQAPPAPFSGHPRDPTCVGADVRARDIWAISSSTGWHEPRDWLDLHCP